MHVFIPFFTLYIPQHYVCSRCLAEDSGLSPALQDGPHWQNEKRADREGEMGVQQMDQDLLAVCVVLGFAFLPLGPARDLSFRGNGPKTQGLETSQFEAPIAYL